MNLNRKTNRLTNKLWASISRVFIVLIVSAAILSACTENSNDVPEVAQTKELELTQFGDEALVIEATSTDKLIGEAINERGANDRGRFNITLKYVVPVTDRQAEVFDAAVARWERVIIGDVPSITPTTFPIPSAFRGFPPVADVGETIDDIVIEVALAPIDGPGGILGQAGPRFVRFADDLTLSGVMFFDVDDLAFLDQLDLFEEVILHEMGHVLGIGTLWSFNRALIDGPFDNPYFTGRTANVHWRAEGGTDQLPIENIGGPGTRFSHWREFTLNNELMTGFLNLGENPLSRITAGSLSDLGYKTAVVGEQYDLPKNTPGVDVSTRDGEAALTGVSIGEQEIILEPVGYIEIR